MPKKTNSDLFAAPWLGEFGWEVSLWVPWLRWNMQHNYSGREMVAMCLKGHEHLYEDFCREVVPIPRPTKITKIDCQNVWFDGIRLRKEQFYSMVAALPGVKQARKNSVLTPFDLQTHWTHNGPPHLGKRGVYRRYGSGEKQEGWVAIHARKSTQNDHRNWAYVNWQVFAESFGAEHMISVGTLKDSWALEGVEDMRGQPLKEVCDAVSRCQVMVGPSSGPMALAMLCATNVVWWSPNPKDVPRFQKLWNPFQVHQAKAEDSWDPHPDDVEVACQKFL